MVNKLNSTDQRHCGCIMEAVWGERTLDVNKRSSMKQSGKGAGGRQNEQYGEQGPQHGQEDHLLGC